MSTGAARQGRAGAARLWLRLFWLSTALTLAVGATLVPHLRDSAELVRMRNALLLQSAPAAYDWTPAAVPADFARETAAPLPLYANIVARNQLTVAATTPTASPDSPPLRGYFRGRGRSPSTASEAGGTSSTRSGTARMHAGS